MPYFGLEFCEARYKKEANAGGLRQGRFQAQKYFEESGSN
jgi:hypothetical protein